MIVLNRTVVVDSLCSSHASSESKMTLKMNTAQVVETVSHCQKKKQSYSGLRSLDDQTQPTFEITPGFKPFTV